MMSKVWFAAVVGALCFRGVGGAGLFLDDSFDVIRDEATAGERNLSRKANVDIINVDGRDVGFCHVPLFQPRRLTWLLDAQAQGAAALLALTMANNGDGSVVKELEGLNERCPLRFTLEPVDTNFSPEVAMEKLLEVLDRKSPEEREACAVLGPTLSASAKPMAIVGGIRGLPMVSSISTSTDLDNKVQYPLFGRTNTSEDGDVAVIILYLKHIGVKHLGLILGYANEEANSATARNFLQISARVYPELKIVSVDLDSVEPDYEEVIEVMRKTQYRYFLNLLVGPTDVAPLLTEAVEQGIAATGEHTWLFTAMATRGSITNLLIEKDSALARAVHGVGFFVNIAGRPGLTVYDNFLTKWYALANDQDLAYLESKKTEGENRNYTKDGIFGERVASEDYGARMFDAAVMVALSSCKAATSGDSPSFDGRSMFDALLNTSFHGATGHVVVDSTTGTRVSTTTRYIMTNYLKQQYNETHVIFSGTEGQVFLDGEWTDEKPFVYNDGSINIPPDLPLYSTDYNHIGTGLRAAGLCMAAVLWLMAVGFAGWTVLQRKAYVVKASQPVFLLILCAGTFIMASAIVPLSIDDDIASDKGCSVACMAGPWLFTIGFALTFAALFSKTWRVNQIFNQPSFRRVKVSALDVMKPLVALLVVNFVVLSIWTAVSPLEWKREVTDTDVFNRITASRGFCRSDNTLPFVIAIAVVNIGALVFTAYQSYLARGVSTEFAESEYIGKTIACMLLACFVGVPTIVIVSDEPRAQFFVLTSIAFVLCASVLLFIFVPKILFARSKPATGATRRESIAASAGIKKATTARLQLKFQKSQKDVESQIHKEEEKKSVSKASTISTSSNNFEMEGKLAKPLHSRGSAASYRGSKRQSFKFDIPEGEVLEGETTSDYDFSSGIRVFNAQHKLSVLEADNEDLQADKDGLLMQNTDLVSQVRELRANRAALQKEKEIMHVRILELEALLSEKDEGGLSEKDVEEATNTMDQKEEEGDPLCKQDNEETKTA